jgi:integrase
MGHKAVRRKTVERFTHQLFTRPAKDGTPVVYVRFSDLDTGEVLATRSTGVSSEKAAKPIVTSLLAELDLETLAKMKEQKQRNYVDDEERLASMSVSDFVVWYWSDEGYHVQEREDADRPLASEYLINARIYTRTEIQQFEPFKHLPLKSIRLTTVEGFGRKLRKAKKSRDVVSRSLDTLRTPVYWAMARGFVESPFTFKTLVLPQKTSKERGVLSEEEIVKIIDLPYTKPWVDKSGMAHLDAKARPRLKGNQKNDGPPILDIRQKTGLLVALFTGMRRGELRGLRWGDIDFESKQISIAHNYVRYDGDKTPKKDSFGVVPIVPELEAMLLEMRIMCDTLEYTSPNDYVLPGKTREKPIADITLKRGWKRALESIGITKELKIDRNLVLHGARHSFATRLLDSGKLSPTEVAKLTRHKDLAMLLRYGGHLQLSTIDKARAVLSITKEENNVEVNDDTQQKS